MSRYFREWHDKATNDYDSLTDQEKKEWKDWQAMQDQEGAFLEQEYLVNQDVPRGTLEIGQRCRIKNTTIFGAYYGPAKNGKSMFYDDELGRVYAVDTYKLVEVNHE